MIAQAGYFYIGISLIIGALGAMPVLGQRKVWLAAIAAQAAIFTITIYLFITALSDSAHSLSMGKIIHWSPSWGLEYAPRLDGLSAAYCLIASLVFFCATLILRSEVNQTKVIVSAIGFFQAGFYAAAFTTDLLAYSMLLAMTSLPFSFLLGFDASEERVKLVRRFLTTEILATFFLVVCAIALRKENHSQLSDWFRLGLGNFELRSSALLFVLFLFGVFLRSQFFPLQTHLRGLFRLQRPAAAIIFTLMLAQAGYTMMRFVPSLFPEDIFLFSTGLTIWALLAATVAIFSLLAATNNADRLTHLATVWLAFLLLGFVSLRREAWTGATIGLILFPAGFLLTIISHWSLARKHEALEWHDFFLYPARGITWLFSEWSLFALPITGGFYVWLLLWWGAIERRPWLLYAGLLFLLLLLGAFLRTLQRQQQLKNSGEPLAEKKVSSDFAWYEYIAIISCVALILFVGLLPNYLGTRLAAVAELLFAGLSAGGKI